MEGSEEYSGVVKAICGLALSVSEVINGAPKRWRLTKITHQGQTM
jgi:hypothetical protein